MTRRLIALLLCIATILSLCTGFASAASTEEEALGEVDIYNGGYELAYLFCSVLGFAGIALLMSALLPGTTAALIAALLITWGPQILSHYLPWSVQQYLRLLPFVSGAEDIFRQNLYHWFGFRIWSPGPLLVFPLLVGVICLPFSITAWCRKRKR